MIRVMAVDDDALVLAGLRAILESTDDIVIVAQADDGADASRLVKTHRPDVVLMDLRMPRVGGHEAIVAIMAAPDPPPILVLTTFDADEQLIASLEAGAVGYLLKDTPPHQIIDSVRETAAGRAILSPDHTRTLLDRYRELGTGARRSDAARRLEGLTEREREVVQHVTGGLSNAEIAAAMYCSPATVKAHLAHIFSRTGISNRVQLAILGHDAGLS